MFVRIRAAIVLTPALRAEASGRFVTPVLRLGLPYCALVAGLGRGAAF
jgi:hypothetical protein